MEIRDRITYALGEKPAELVIKNAKVVNVFSGDISEGDVAIADGIIVGVGEYSGETEVDAGRRYLMPGFINAHLHVESSMVSPRHYAEAELAMGTTTIITDPHEIVNVAGHEGVKYILSEAGKTRINYYVMMPSCVPSTPFEHAGAVMIADSFERYMDDSHLLGLGEMMNYVGVIGRDPEVLAKLEMFKDKPIDGHAPGLTGRELMAYKSAGILTEHECTTFDEALEKLRAGFAILIREGSASKNLEAIVRGIVETGTDTSYMAFATDDKHLYDIYREGTIRHNIVKAVSLGLDPVKAVQMATINPARIYGLRDVGAIVPGYRADIVLTESLDEMKELEVYKDGVRVEPIAYVSANDGTNHDWQAESESDKDFCRIGYLSELKHVQKDAAESAVVRAEASEYVGDSEAKKNPAIYDSVHIASIDGTPIAADIEDENYVIGLVDGQIITEKLKYSRDELTAALESDEVNYISVIERHHKLGSVGRGFIRGYGLRRGAVATTVAHDSHNIIVVGADEESMRQAVRTVAEIHGGYVCVDGEDACSLPLEICGLMSAEEPEHFAQGLGRMIAKARSMGVGEGIDPFTTLSFTALPVIPSLRITDMGMFDVDAGKLIK